MSNFFLIYGICCIIIPTFKTLVWMGMAEEKLNIKNIKKYFIYSESVGFLSAGIVMVSFALLYPG